MNTNNQNIRQNRQEAYKKMAKEAIQRPFLDASNDMAFV
jgi:hypothetical protein